MYVPNRLVNSAIRIKVNDSVDIILEAVFISHPLYMLRVGCIERYPVEDEHSIRIINLFLGAFYPTDGAVYAERRLASFPIPCRTWGWIWPDDLKLFPQILSS